MSTDLVIAALVYVLAAAGCVAVWWRVTAGLAHRGWRELLRGTALVLLFTPWWVAGPPAIYAPAFVLLVGDLVLEGGDRGMPGLTALLVATFVMLLVLTVRQWRAHRTIIGGE